MKPSESSDFNGPVDPWGRLIPGSQLFGGRFRIVRQLGSGTGGAVYEALDGERGEAVALKVLLREDGVGLLRLKQEFRALADVAHSNVVRLYELFGEDGSWFFTMELVPGRHLLLEAPLDVPDGPGIHGRDAPEPSREAATPPEPDESSSRAIGRSYRAEDPASIRRWLRGLAEGLRAIHLAGKLHRDLKPSNVLLTPDGRVVILDFGLVTDRRRLVERPRAGRRVPGTPAFVAPEVVLGHHGLEASDWYAVGVILHCALFGRLPFDGAPAEVLQRKVREEAAFRGRPGEHPADPELEELCLRLLERKPEKRSGYDEVVRLVDAVAPEEPRTLIPPSEPASSLFVGREAELGVVRREFGLIKTGRRGRAVFLRGESGIGKTALLTQAVLRVQADDPSAWVLRSACYERENVPFKALDQAIDEFSLKLESWETQRLQRILPEWAELLPLIFPAFSRWSCFNTSSGPQLIGDLGASGEPALLRRSAFQALGTLMARATAGAPIVLALDDLQWTDLDSVRLLLELFAMEEPPALFLLGTYRAGPESQAPALQALLSGMREQGIPLREVAAEELSPNEALDLVRGVSQELTEKTALKLAEEARGLPYFTQQLAWCHRQGSLPPEPTLEGMLRLQVEALSAEVRELLAHVALSPGPVRRSVLFRALGEPTPRSKILAELRQLRLIRILDAGANSRVLVYHDLLRDAVLSAWTPEEQQNAHARLAEAWLQESDGDLDARFHHLLGAGRAEEAGRVAVEAARAAEHGLAFERAARGYEEALLLSKAGDETQRELLIAEARCWDASGHGPRAAERYLQAAESASSQRRSQLRWEAAKALLKSRSDATELLAEVLADVGFQLPTANQRTGRVARRGLATWLFPSWRIPSEVSGPTDERAAELFDRLLAAGIGMMFGGDLDLCVFLLVEATRVGRRTGEPGRVACACALHLEAEIHVKGLSQERVRARVGRIQALLLQSTDANLVASGHLLLGQCSYSVGDLSAALREFQTARAKFDDIVGGMQLAEEARTSESFMLLLRGEVREAGRMGERLVMLGGARSQPFFTRSGHIDLAHLRLAEGDVRAARRHLDLLSERKLRELSWFDVMALQVGALLGAYDPAYRIPLAHFDEAEAALRSLASKHHYRPWLLLGKAIALLDRLTTPDPSSDLPPPRTAIALALSCAKELQERSGIRVLWPYGAALEASAKMLATKTQLASVVETLALCEERFEAYGLLGYKNMLRRRRGMLLGLAHGRELIGEADEALGKLGVADPERLTCAQFPGFLFGGPPPDPGRDALG